MAKKSQPLTVSSEQIEQQIYIVRGQRVMLDSDLAALYGVATSRLNEQVGRNRDRFPIDFAFQLTRQEFTALMSQFATSKAGRGGRRKLPWAFTEQGVAMLSGVLRSQTAVNVHVEIIRAFVRVRRLLATPGELVAQLLKLAETVQLHDDQIKTITEVLKRMVAPPSPAPTPDRRIGFQMPGGSEGGASASASEDEQE
jgi:hypothetical protein